VINFRDISYLLRGSDEQKKVYKLLTEEGLMQKLSQYDPVLVGTFPLDIQVSTSDIDLVCHVKDLAGFRDFLIDSFGKYPHFEIRHLTRFDPPAVVAGFSVGGQEIEIFGQDKPSDLQMGYLHLVVEHQILLQYGQTFKDKVIQLKASGMKTEPAFCQLLGIMGDPYVELLKYDLSR
jgi:hypothetical protein